jgi:hypothetical protein
MKQGKKGMCSTFLAVDSLFCMIIYYGILFKVLKAIAEPIKLAKRKSTELVDLDNA